MLGRHVLVTLAILTIVPLLAQPTLAGTGLVHTFAGSASVKHVGGGAVACQATGDIRIDLYTASGIVPVTSGLADATLTGPCFSGSEKYTAALTTSWTLTDPLTNVPGRLIPVNDGTWNLNLLMRMPGEPQANFTQVTAVGLVETTSP